MVSGDIEEVRNMDDIEFLAKQREARKDVLLEDDPYTSVHLRSAYHSVGKDEGLSRGLVMAYNRFVVAHFGTEMNRALKDLRVHADDTALRLSLLNHGEVFTADMMRAVRSRYRTMERVRKRLRAWLARPSGSVWFLTLTFRDEVWAREDITERTLRGYVSAYLKRSFPDYVANKDYGERNGRMHFHAVAWLPEGEEPPSAWRYGFCQAKPVKPTEGSTKALTKYLQKLTNHAVKRQNSAVRLIWSRR